MANTNVAQAVRRDTQALTRLYFVYFVSWGIYQAYLNLYFKRIGLNGAEIGFLSAIRPFTIMVIPPLAGYIADRYGRPRRILTWIITGGVLPYFAMLMTADFLAILPGMVLFSMASGAVIPLLDANALDVLEGDRNRYGLLRRWGSFGYMVSVIIAGQLSRYIGIPTLLSVSGIVLAGAGVLAHLFSYGETGKSLAVSTRPWWVEAGAAWRQIAGLPGMPVFFLAGLLGWTASGTYYNFFSIYADELGMSESLIGLAWGTAVVSEIVMLSLSTRLLTRLGAKGMFALGLTAAAIRWTLYAVVHNPYVVLLLQTLHGFTFGTLQAGAVTYLHSVCAPEMRSSAQTLWVAITGGVAGVAGAYLVGPLSDVFGLRTMFVLSGALALAGALVGWFGLRKIEPTAN